MLRSDEDLDQRCAAVVARLLSRHGWQLIEQGAFVRRTCAALEEAPGLDPQFAAYGVYNQALHRACSGAEGPDRRDLAYRELYRTLYERAWHSYRDLCEDATQLALVEVIARFEACRNPRAFIPFALLHLMGAARTLRRQERRAESLERSIGVEGRPLGDSLADATLIEETLVVEEEREAIEAFLARYVRQNPRSRKQIDAVRLKYLGGMDDERISKELGVSIENVYVLRSRGLSRLRNVPGWRQIWEDED